MMRSFILAALAFLTPELASAADAPAIDPKEKAELTLKAPDTLKVKEEGKLSFAIKPEKGWKVSLEAPLSLKLSNGGKVIIAKRKLGAKDGVTQGKGFVFKTNLKAATAGADTVKAKAVYFLCTDDVCKRFSATREIALKVN